MINMQSTDLRASDNVNLMTALVQHPLKILQLFYTEICLLSVSESEIRGKYQFLFLKEQQVLKELHVSVQPSADNILCVDPFKGVRGNIGIIGENPRRVLLGFGW